jgi:phosphoacetylglucosamine mutase
LFQAVVATSLKYGTKPGVPMSYGTAGFRCLGDKLPLVCFRVGLFANLLSIKRNAPVGIVITASHNQAQDNGVKIIENTGHMLDQSLEHISEKIVNVESTQLPKELEESLIFMGLNEKTIEENKGTVLIGRDTRISSKPLSDITM